MATVEDLEKKLEGLRERLQKKIEASEDPSVDRVVRMTRKKVKRTQRRIRKLKAKEGKASAATQNE
jgi:hypothetical protein